MYSEPILESEAGKNQAQKGQKNKGSREFWSEHRITLIAYEVQYVHQQKPGLRNQEIDQDEEGEENDKKRKTRNKINLRYESGFLSIQEQESADVDVKTLAKQYQYLSWLFYQKVNANFSAVRQFMKIMLELKHSRIIMEFAAIYNEIVKCLQTVTFQQIVKEQERSQWVENTKETTLKLIEKNGEVFPYFTSYLSNMPIETKKLLTVEVYCFLGELFYFNINQYYCEAFAVIGKNKGSKKVKKQN